MTFKRAKAIDFKPEIVTLCAAGYSLRQVAEFIWIHHRVKVTRSRIQQIRSS